MELLYPDGFYTHPGEKINDKVPRNNRGLLRYLTAYLASPLSAWEGWKSIQMAGSIIITTLMRQARKSWK